MGGGPAGVGGLPRPQALPGRGVMEVGLPPMLLVGTGALVPVNTKIGVIYFILVAPKFENLGHRPAAPSSRNNSG